MIGHFDFTPMLDNFSIPPPPVAFGHGTTSFSVLPPPMPFGYETTSFSLLPTPFFGHGADHLSVPSTSAYRIHDFVLDYEEQEHYGFPMPGPDFKPSKSAYIDFQNESPLFVLDCEMCITDAKIHELTEDGDVVLDTLVQPPNVITNHVTEFSGITPAMMKGVTTTLNDVHAAIDALLPPDAILVGHSLNCDLQALKMTHPYCIDTSLEFNDSGNPMRRSKLRDLCEVYLGRQIQKSRGGHCSIEDCAATMELAQLKLSKDDKFGNVFRGFNPATNWKPQPKIRPLIGGAPAHYRPHPCVECAASMRVECSSRDTCSCWWREDVYTVCVQCIADNV